MTKLRQSRPHRGSLLRSVLMRSVLILVSLVFTFSTQGSQFLTYEFVGGQDPLLRYGGGLLGIDVAASLVGSFDLTIENDGTSTISRFDVQVVDILDEGIFDPNWREGDLLLSKLFENPVGIAGEIDTDVITIGSPGILLSGPATRIILTLIDGQSASFSIRSLPEVFLDNPSFHTDEPGFLLRLVPEPTTGLLAAVALAWASTQCRSAWRRRYC